MISLELITLLNTLYDRVPFSITRMISTPLRNHAVGGAKGSWHLDLSTDPNYARPCGAADLVFDTNKQLWQAAGEAQAIGFGGIELDETNLHLHVDIRPLSEKWWVVHTKEGNKPLAVSV